MNNNVQKEFNGPTHLEQISQIIQNLLDILFIVHYVYVLVRASACMCVRVCVFFVGVGVGYVVTSVFAAVVRVCACSGISHMWPLYTHK